MIFYENISRFSTQIKFNLHKNLMLLVLALTLLDMFSEIRIILILLFNRVEKQKHTINCFMLQWFSRFHEFFFISWHFIRCVCILESFLSEAKILLNNMQYFEKNSLEIYYLFFGNACILFVLIISFCWYDQQRN